MCRAPKHPCGLVGGWKICRSSLLIWTFWARGAPEASLQHQPCLVAPCLISEGCDLHGAPHKPCRKPRNIHTYPAMREHAVNDWLLLGLWVSFRSLTSGPVTPKPCLWTWRKHGIFLGLSLRLISGKGFLALKSSLTKALNLVSGRYGRSYPRYFWTNRKAYERP